MRRAPLILFCALLTAIKCDAGPRPPKQEPVVRIDAKPLPVGTSFRAELSSESVIPRFLSKRKAKRTGQIRAVDTRTSLSTKFYAELLALSPEKWRLDFESFARTTQTMGAEEATSSFDLPDKAFYVELGDPIRVTDEHGVEATESQAQYATAVVRVLQERDHWVKFLPTREFSRGKIIEAPKGFVVGRLVDAEFGPPTDPHTTVGFFRYDADAAEREVAHFEVHSRFKASEPEMTDGSYFDFEAKGSVVVRTIDGTLMGYDVDAKVKPRASTGAMLPEGSGTWRMSFDIEAPTLQRP